MLTSYQVEVIAGVTEHGEILCLVCAASEFTKPLIRYALDEEQEARGESYFEAGYDGHSEECGCAPELTCERCDGDLVEAYDDPNCEQEV